MKEYMIVCKGRFEDWDSISAQEWNQVMVNFETWVGELRSKNQYGCGVQLPRTFKSIAKFNDKIETLDGPFTESKETLTGYFMIKADSLDQAVEICKSHPSLYRDRLEIFELADQKGEKSE